MGPTVETNSALSFQRSWIKAAINREPNFREYHFTSEKEAIHHLGNFWLSIVHFNFVPKMLSWAIFQYQFLNNRASIKYHAFSCSNPLGSNFQIFSVLWWSYSSLCLSWLAKVRKHLHGWWGDWLNQNVWKCVLHSGICKAMHITWKTSLGCIVKEQ